MAYITAERTREIKKELKQAFPKIKFSVVNRHSMEVDVAIMESDIDFSDILEDRTHTTVNHYWIDKNYPTHAELLKKIYAIVNKGNHDNSDIMTDYFDVGFYVTLEIGKWDKPYVCRKGKVTA